MIGITLNYYTKHKKMNTFTTIVVNDPKSFSARLKLAWAILIGKQLEVGLTQEEAKAIYEQYKKENIFDGPKEIDPDWVKSRVDEMVKSHKESASLHETAEIQKAMEAIEEKDAPVELKKPAPVKKSRPRNRPKKTNGESAKPTSNAAGKGPRTRRPSGDSNA